MTTVVSAPTYDEIEVGQELPALERVPTKKQLVMYAGAEDDYMPVHFDHHYALAAGQPGVINHGWLTYAIVLQSVTNWLPPEVATIVSTKCRYLRPAYPEQAVVCRGQITAKSESGGVRTVEVEAMATNPAGELTTKVSVSLQFA